MREIAEIELAIQGGTEKIETFGEKPGLFIWMRTETALQESKER